MNNIDIEATESSPKVLLDAKNGVIEIEGKSYPENTFEFYNPVIDWLEEYFNDDSMDKTVINLKLIYFNSGTAQTLFNILDIVQDGKHKELVINWYYDKNDEDGKNDYEDYSEEFPDLNIKAIEF